MITYPLWIEDLIAKTANTLTGPEDEVADGEQEIGVVPDELKPLYHAMDPLIAEIKEIETRRHDIHKISGHTNEYDELNKRLVEVKRKVACLHGLFWVSLQHACGTFGKDLAIRKWWKVVLTVEDPDEAPHSGHMIIMMPDNFFKK